MGPRPKTVFATNSSTSFHSRQRPTVVRLAVQRRMVGIPFNNGGTRRISRIREPNVSPEPCACLLICRQLDQLDKSRVLLMVRGRSESREVSCVFAQRGDQLIKRSSRCAFFPCEGKSENRRRPVAAVAGELDGQDKRRPYDLGEMTMA